jgi:hypothetical protein
MPVKHYWILLTLLAAAANAQPTISGDVQSQGTKWESETSKLFREPKPNQIVSGDLTYSGILVEVVKVDNPLQLINPFAPSSYGAAEENVAWDPISNKATGLKFFSIQF